MPKDFHAVGTIDAVGGATAGDYIAGDPHSHTVVGWELVGPPRMPMADRDTAVATVTFWLQGEFLLEQYADVDSTGSTGLRHVRVAARHGLSDVNVANGNGLYPLCPACEYGQLAAKHIIIDSGASVGAGGRKESRLSTSQPKTDTPRSSVVCLTQNAYDGPTLALPAVSDWASSSNSGKVISFCCSPAGALDM